MNRRKVEGQKNRMLFVADAARIPIDEEGKFFLPGEFSDSMLERYMKLCDELVILCRKGDEILSTDKAKKTYNACPLDNIKVVYVKDKFASIRNYLSPSVKKFNSRLIENEIRKADFVIVRTFSSMSTKRFYKLLRRYHKKVLVESVCCSWDAMWNHGIKGKVLAPYSFIDVRRRIWKAD